MRNPTPAVLCLFWLLSCSGCAFQVYVAGVPVSEAAPLPAGATLCTARDPEAKATDVDARIAQHLGQLLTGRGFRIAGPDEASYCVLYGHEVEAIMATMRLQFIRGAKGGIESVRRKGPFNYRLSLRLVEASVLRTGSPASLWHGGAVISETPTMSARHVDMMLVALLDQFPRDTQGTLKRRMFLGDSRLRRLRSSEEPEASEPGS